MIGARLTLGELRRRRERRLAQARGFLALLVALWLAFIAFAYTALPPSLVLLTVFPAWLWFVPCIPLLILSLSRASKPRTLVLLCGWLLFLLVACEETRVPLTWGRHWDAGRRVEAASEAGIVRVVTANCGGGIPEAAAEALAYDPDILLLQESPSAVALQEVLADHPGYELLWGIDVSLLANGHIEPVPPSDDPLVTRGAVVEIRGRRFGVVNAHLHLPHLTGRFWSPGEWRLAAEAYRHREDQMRSVLDVVASLDESAPGVPMVIGGDWNTPPADPLFRFLRPRFRDSFREAGIGLGDSIVNEIPVSRIDQIYIDGRLRAHAVVTRRTVASDHRFVIADLEPVG